jgi:hypothetical protein
MNSWPTNAAEEDYRQHETVIHIPSDTSNDTYNTNFGTTRVVDEMEIARTMESPTTAKPNDGPLDGYERISKLMNSDKDFLLFRRFGDLNIRNILYLQDRLSEIVEKLAEEDEKPTEKPGSRRWDGNPERGILMAEAEDCLRRYSKFIL